MPKVCLEDGLRVVRGRAASGHFTVGPGHEVLALKADEMIGRGAFCGDADRMTGPVAVNRGDRVATGLLFPFLECPGNLRSIVGCCYLH
jgi:hypothetical protein